MIRFERLLFYPAVVAATVFAVREALVSPSTPAFAALGALSLLWFFIVFRAFFWVARMVFWTALVAGLGAWLWIKVGTPG